MPKIILESGELHELSFIQVEKGHNDQHIAIILVYDGPLDLRVFLVPELPAGAASGEYTRITLPFLIAQKTCVNVEWVAKKIAMTLSTAP